MKNLFITVLGKKGSGKSYFVKSILNNFPQPVFVLDSLDEYTPGVIFNSGYIFLEYLKMQKPNISGVYILRPENDNDVKMFFETIFSIGNCTTVIEETSIYCNPYKIDENFKKILNYGRHKSINLIAIARRASEIHRDITAQSDCIVSFKQTESRDISILESVDEKAKRLNELGQYEYLILGDFENNELFKSSV